MLFMYKSSYFCPVHSIHIHKHNMLNWKISIVLKTTFSAIIANYWKKWFGINWKITGWNASNWYDLANKKLPIWISVYFISHGSQTLLLQSNQPTWVDEDMDIPSLIDPIVHLGSASFQQDLKEEMQEEVSQLRPAFILPESVIVSLVTRMVNWRRYSR